MTKRLFSAAGDPRDSRGTEPVQRIAGPGELLQAVPYLLGFHPDRSLVLVGLRDGMLVVTARMDLADAPGPDGAGPLVGTLASMCAGGATEIIGVVYGDEPAAAIWPDPDLALDGELPWAQLADDLAQLIDTLPCRLHDVLLVIGEQWWSFSCDSARCCPSAGRPLPAAPSVYATRATVDGVVPLPDRATFAAMLDPLPDVQRERLQPLLQQARNDAAGDPGAGASQHARAVKRALFATARASAQPRWCPPSDVEVARFAAALRTTSIRDAVWLAVDARRIDGRPLWRELARRVPSPDDAPPLFLYGWASWRAGDGALAGIAGDRAIASDPDYTAADLLLAALSHGLDPRRFPRLNLTA